MKKLRNISPRRDFLKSIPLLAAAPYFKESEAAVNLPVGCNSYNWLTFYRREGKEWGKDLDDDFKQFSKTGIKAYEPGLSGLDEVIKLMPVLKKYGIEMPSVYFGSSLHVKELAEGSIQSALKIADAVKGFGTRIMVTNPSPVKWGGSELKSDEELIFQAQNLERLGKELKKRGIILAYHTHDVELKAGAREFHHMLLNTRPEYVSFCFDVHWVYRGSGNSEVAVFDVLKLYGSRIAELHLRQSKGEVWAETFEAAGDIDYARLAQELKRLKLRPHLVIEQCVEDKSLNTLDAIEAHISDLANVEQVFKPILQP